MKPTFFKSPLAFREWLEKNHLKAKELPVGFYKKGSGKPSITWPESVDEALCFGWIDGVRKSIDETSYTIRFTPRRAQSIWSAINIKRASELSDGGAMRPAGLRAFEARQESKSGIYAYEQRAAAKLCDADERQFQADAAAWKYFQAQAPWYRRTATWWVVSAKKEETRLRRLGILIESSAQGRSIGPLTRPATKSKRPPMA
jgi:uncharacterized protein YdeI (YjbR/CyaY-like superfamily)